MTIPTDELIRCVLCNEVLPVYMILCSRCERAACAEHFVFEEGHFDWLCPPCNELLGGLEEDEERPHEQR